MEDIISEFKKDINTFETLKKYHIEFGVLVEDEFKTVEVNVINTDDTITKVPMFVGDVMYLTEYGTLTIPARPILDQALTWINNELDKIIEDVFVGIFRYNWKEEDIDARMQRFSTEIQTYIQSQMELMIGSNSNLASLINVEDENRYLYDLNKLKYYIKCKIFKKT